MNDKLLQSIYSDLGLESNGVDFQNFKSKMQNSKELRNSVWKDLGLESNGISFDVFESKLGVTSVGGDSMGKLKALKRALLKKLLQWTINKCNNLLQKL